jgi:hypothetical protein
VLECHVFHRWELFSLRDRTGLEAQTVFVHTYVDSLTIVPCDMQQPCAPQNLNAHSGARLRKHRHILYPRVLPEPPRTYILLNLSLAINEL